MAFNNITILAFGKRFENCKDGVIDKKGLELIAIVVNAIELGESLNLI